MKIIFFGTPDFAVASLEAINQSNHEIVSVVTSVDKPAGRGKNKNIPVIRIGVILLAVDC